MNAPSSLISTSAEQSSPMTIHRDCKYFRGDLPCTPHKTYGVHCDTCTHYTPQDKNILIIKLGAIGDVIRTTPLLHRLQKEYPTARIWWITYSPEIVPSVVDKILPFTLASLTTLHAIEFDTIINLDKDTEACALLVNLKGKEKIGYTLRDGKPAPADDRAYHKYLTGLFDDVNKANTKSYVQEIFEICGWEFQGEEYIQDPPPIRAWNIPHHGKKIIGLNTGCGGRWTSRLWAEERWEQFIHELTRAGYFPMLLGGEQEDEKNRRLAERTGAYYAGYFSLRDFTSLMNECDCIVTAVTMAMHLAMGLHKPLVLFVNIFNPHEFEMYGRGSIVQPANECHCFFKATCTHDAYQCMEHLHVDTVLTAVHNALAQA